MDAKSIFSINTNQTAFKSTHPNPQPQHNPLHQYFHTLLPTFSKQCPYLSKIFYLQLLLRQNILIFTQDRVDVRDIWLSISRMLELKKPEIYVVEGKFNMDEVLATKNQYRRVLVYDVGQLSGDNLNRINNGDGEVSFMGVENPGVQVGAHIADLFSFILQYNQQQTPTNLLQTLHNPTPTPNPFPKKPFNETIQKIFHQIVQQQQQQQQQTFLKPFLQCFQFKLQKNNIKISQSKWKKMLRIVQFMGVNKMEGQFRRIGLADFVLCPELLGGSLEQIGKIRGVLFQVLVEFVPYYGQQKFQKPLKTHFWFSKTHHKFCKNLLQNLPKTPISFFYPCLKFPQTASLISCPTINYRIQGYEKKLMSDHHIQVDVQRKYLFGVEVRADCGMTVHVGVACYDKGKNVILPVQACRKEGTEVVYQRIEADKIIVKNIKNLQKWNNKKQNFAYQRAIGTYFTGQTNQLLPITQILYNQAEPYSKTDYPYTQISFPNQTEDNNNPNDKDKDEGEITLSAESKNWLVNYRHLLEKNRTIFMNHYQGSVGCIGECLRIQGQGQGGDWRKVEGWYQGVEWGNTGRNFFPGTKYVRIVLMVNYNDGYPNFQIDNKNGVFEFRNIKFMLQE